MSLALTSGTTSGTSGSMRKRAVLSTTTAPAATAMGANLSLTLPPAENKPMSISLNESSLRMLTRICLSLKRRNWPADLSDAKRRSSPTGNSRSSKISRICSPTAPVAPTTATLYFSFFTILSFQRLYLVTNKTAHFFAAHRPAIFFLNIEGPISAVQYRFNRALDPVCGRPLIQRMTQHESDRQNRCQRICLILAGDIGSTAVDRFIHPDFTAETSRGKHADGTGEHRRLIA